MSSISDRIALFRSKLNSQHIFVLAIQNGEMRCVKGNVNLKFQNDCKDVIQEMRLTSGHISGTKQADGKIKLQCSKSIPAIAAQRFRNIWSFYN